MTEAFIDTNIIIRLLTGDDLKKQQAAAKLLEKVAVGTLTIFAPLSVIADCVYILSSPRLYNLRRSKIRDLLSPLIKLSHFKLENKEVVLLGLDIYVGNNIDFSDALLISFTLQTKTQMIYSFDHDFDNIKNIKRVEPK